MAATEYQSKKFLRRDICKKYIGLHGTYPALMLKYWILTQEINKYSLNYNSHLLKYNIPDIDPFFKVCNKTKNFDVRYFWDHVRFYPKPCKDNPVWSITNQTFIGREDLGEDANF